MNRNPTTRCGLDPQHLKDLIKERFADARVPLVWADSPRAFTRGVMTAEGEPLFMMDVRRRSGNKHPKEYILLHFGNGAEVQVLDVDPKLHQLVLRVYEPQSKVIRKVWKPRQLTYVLVPTLVPASTRSMLVGMDERHLFVCPLEQHASSVGEAHRKLQPDAVRRRSRKVRKRSKRQGEWFFVAVDDQEALDAIAEVVHREGPQRRVPVGESQGSRPHLADEVVVVDGVTYVRGRVRHPDHHVLKLNGWHRVHLNTETRTARIAGMTWVD